MAQDVLPDRYAADLARFAVAQRWLHVQVRVHTRRAQAAPRVRQMLAKAYLHSSFEVAGAGSRGWLHEPRQAPPAPQAEPTAYARG
ncbi:hypothetical protein BUPH_06774 [Paraburkholderia phenoliruptrix BR3459a]|uniref:Uncharacterized protein n=1 Tax=Paraburkholderia phenoliruptrix BR3459a TaxID=1229205 RepID=K0DS87_9BURK|nr:hypothetical protein BUPH_06774 [Paraburkholderia phenoliruptrix BR3459a]